MLAKALQGATAAADKLYIESVFQTWLYTGNGSTQTITNGIDLSGKGGLVWIKGRSGATNHRLFDTAQGATNFLESNSTAQQQSSAASLTSFNSDGFSIGASSPINTSSSTYASWTFRKAAKFFDAVTFTANSSGGGTFSHSLGVTPGMVIMKATGATENWLVWHRSLSANGLLVLNLTNGEFNVGTPFFTTLNATTATVANGMLPAGVNAPDKTYVAYLFAHDAGGFGDSGNESVVKCGTFTCDGSGNVGTVDLGWEPQWILTKKTNGTQSWYQWDNMRGWALTTSSTLSPNLSDAEVAMGGTSYLYPTATGFAGNGNFFGPSAQVIYIAIRRGPMKTPTDATKVFSANTWTGTGTTQQITTGFFPDACLTIDRNKAATNLNYLFDNLRGVNVESYTNSTAAEGTDSGKAFTMTGLSNNSGNLNSTLGVYVGEFFRRAPGFFDVVAYTGTGVARTVNHNLGVAPELMIVKARNDISFWMVYAGLNTSRLLLNTDSAYDANSSYWNNTSPTSSVFSLGTNGNLNGSGLNHIAYLFATLAGISKVGSYTGTGTTQQINCGFTAGSRLVLIKRTDSTGSWYIWDSARGIISGNDPYLLLNSTAAEVTNTDYIDPYSPGFEISSSAPAEINANGGSYIFLAVA